MRIGPETEKKAAAAMQKLKAVDAAGEWDKLTETDFYWAVVHCVNEYMNLEEVWNRPIIDLPWSVDEWREEVRANTRKAYDMFLGYMPSEYKRKFSESKAISADRIANYLSRCWESRDFYEGWNGRWKWRYSIPGSWVPPYEEREQYVLYLQSLESNGGEAKMDADARIREMIQARELIRATTMAKLRAKARLKANRKVKAEAKGTAKGDAKYKDLKKAKATQVYSTSQHAEAAGPNEHPMDVSPNSKPDDEAPGPTVVGAQKMLGELHL